MRPTGQLVIEEQLAPARLMRRWMGAGVAAFIVILVAVALRAALAGGAGSRSAGAWGVENAGLAAGLAVGFGMLAGVAVLAFTWLPQRHRFHVDRANAYVVLGRRVRRHALAELGLSSDPPTLHVGGQEYLITADDYRRLAGLLRVAVPLRSKFAKPVAQSNPTVIEEKRRAARKVRRHPTLL